MKANGKIIKNKEKVKWFFQIKIFMREIGKMTSKME
jgi:hypothetical protein